MNRLQTPEAESLYEQTINIIREDRWSAQERIPKYRALLEELFRLLTKDAPTHLGNLFARQVYVGKNFNVPRSILDMVHSLRKTGNDVVHNVSEVPKPIDDQRCVYLLCESISYFSGLPIPSELYSFYANRKMDFARANSPHSKAQQAETRSFRAVVVDVGWPEGPQTDHLPVKLKLETEEQETVTLKLWNRLREDGQGSDLRPFARWVNRYQTIYVERAVADRDRPGEWFAGEKTFLVLEPDYLLDAKALANCRQLQGDNPLLYLLEQFTQGQVSANMVRGNLVGQILDDLATDPQHYTFKKSFVAVMTQNPLQFLYMANDNGRYHNATVRRVWVEGEQQEATIRWALAQKKGHRKMVEPTFISNLYGLLGRIDLLTVDPNDPHRKDIVELKSGKYPDIHFGMYPNHEAQTLAYDLLLRSTFPSRWGNNDILYAAAPRSEKPLRNIPGEHYRKKQQLLQLRNQVVANDLLLASGQLDPLEALLSDDIGPLPKYKQQDHETFRETIQQLDPLSKAYFEAYLGFIYRELRTAKIGASDIERSMGFAATWLASTSEKIDDANALVYLKVEEVTDDRHVHLVCQQDLFAQTPGFRQGDMVILYPTPDPEVLDPLSAQILKAFIEDIQDTHVRLRLLHRQVDKAYFSQKSYWAIERDFRDSSFKKMLHLLYRFAQAEADYRALILGQRAPASGPLPDCPRGDLNAVQHREVCRALAARDYYLLQGPPGTGKTSKVLCEIVQQRQAEGAHVLVMAFTNRAVDEIGDRLQERGVDCIRLGHSNKPYSWQRISSDDPQLEKLYNRMRDTRVIVSTQSSFVNSLDLLSLKTFDTLVVDEASQLLEPQLVGILPYFRRFILIGDENQLPAVVVQSESSSSCTEKALQHIGLDNLRESLFARLKRQARANGWTEAYGLLSIHYRMHRDIADFPNHTFYEGRLTCGSERQEQRLSAKNEPPTGTWQKVFGEHRVAFVPTRRSARRKVNEQEAKLVVDMINYIIGWYGDDFDPIQTVGVITPYRAQIARIRQELPAALRNTVMVDTVERFQGSERDIILMSLAINHPTQLRALQSINAAGVDRKLNVALTRAREYLVLLGTEDYLRAAPVYRKLLGHIRQHGAHYGIDAPQPVAKDVGEGLF